MEVTFEQVDVFTERPFAGNPLCVVPDGTGLSPEQMQAIAREMNLSETTFVLPPTDPQAAYWMRIFTPAKEIPFAGHPSVGTAYVMAAAGRFPLQAPVTRIYQQVGIGTLPLDIAVADGKPGRVVINLSTTKAVDDIAAAHSSEITRAKVGEINVVEKMLEVGARIGGERPHDRAGRVQDFEPQFARDVGGQELTATGVAVSPLMRRMRFPRPRFRVGSPLPARVM